MTKITAHECKVKDLTQTVPFQSPSHCSCPLPPWAQFQTHKLISFGGMWASQAALVVKNLPANAGDLKGRDSIPVSGRSPGVGNGSPTPVFLPGKSHGQKSLLGYRPWGHKESDMTEHTCMHACTLQKQYGKKLCLRTRTCQISLALT